MKVMFHDSPTCPKCHGDNVEGDFIEIGMDGEGQVAWQTVRCNDCGFKYVDVYRYHHSEAYEEE